MYVAGSVSGVAATSLLSVLYCYLTHGDFNAEHFYRPGKYVYGIQIRFSLNIILFIRLRNKRKTFESPFSLPWDQMTSAGYFAEVLSSISFGYVCFDLNGVQLLFFISLCIHHQAFSKMFEHSIE